MNTPVFTKSPFATQQPRTSQRQGAQICMYERAAGAGIVGPWPLCRCRIVNKAMHPTERGARKGHAEHTN